MTEYMISQYPDVSQLVNAINQLIALGWKPLGNVTVAIYGNKVMYIQALTR